MRLPTTLCMPLRQVIMFDATGTLDDDVDYDYGYGKNDDDDGADNNNKSEYDDDDGYDNDQDDVTSLCMYTCQVMYQLCDENYLQTFQV